jgi:hypothetical protein
LIHDYFGLSWEEVYYIIKKELPIFEKEIVLFFKKLWKTDSMKIAVKDMLDYLSSMGRDKSILQLTKLTNSFSEKTMPKKRVSKIKK